MANTKNSIYLSDELQKYLEEQCDVFGMGKSAFVSMILTFYRQQQQAMGELAKFQEYMQRMEDILARQEQINAK